MNRSEKARIRASEWYYANKERKKAYDLQYNKTHRDKRNEQSRGWVANNPSSRQRISKQSYERHKRAIFANCAAARARKLKAAPTWLTKEQRDEMKAFYKNRPDGCEVDHIVPLAGRKVSGLHVPWNLQYLTKAERGVNLSKPWAVLVADVHYSLPTLELADSAMRMAIAKSNALRVPLIVAGDLHDTKGAMRGECVKAMMTTFSSRDTRLPCYIIPGNHDRINEKAKPHSLEFLRPLVSIIDVPTSLHGLWMIPYENDVTELQSVLKNIAAGATLVMHTGLKGAMMGHYSVDKSSLEGHVFHGLRVISGHYHARQDIPIPGGVFSYIGNPYTLNYGEALDPPKGFQVLNTDGSLTFIPTNLRKHVVLERNYNDVLAAAPEYLPGDLVRLRVTGPKSELEKLDRQEIGRTLFGTTHYKLELLPTADVKPDLIQAIAPTVGELMDAIIDASSETPERKSMLKSLWRSMP